MCICLCVYTYICLQRKLQVVYIGILKCTCARLFRNEENCNLASYRTGNTER